MPDIVGSGQADVKNDVGTLNGAPQGSPINNINMASGSDTVTVSNSTISGNITTGSSDDDITISFSTVVGTIDSGQSADTVVVSGSVIGDIDLGSSDDDLTFYNSSVSGTIDAGSGNNSLNLPEGTVVNDSSAGIFTVALGVGYTITSGSFTLPTGQTVTYTSFDQGTGVVCFANGTLIRMPDKDVRVEDLAVGDEVSTFDGGTEQIRWIGRRRVRQSDLSSNPQLRPVRITAGALGSGLPKRDLIVSRQHRMLVRSPIASRMFGTSEVLIAAVKLTKIPGIFVDENIETVEYFHVLLDRHMTIIAEGAPSESLYTGSGALNALPAAAREELASLFPELRGADHGPKPNRFIPSNKRQRQLVSRHLRNNRPLLDGLGQTQAN